MASGLLPVPGEIPRKNPVFLAALSGGADSTAMAAALAALRDARREAGPRSPEAGEFPFVLRAIHVNHNIRHAEECTADEEAVSSLCGALDIPLTCIDLPPGLVKTYAREKGTGIEGAARHFRHGAFRREAKRIGAEWILIAHTADDHIENILMGCIKGSGPQGLGGLGQINENRKIKRPLLCLNRAEVLAYLRHRGLHYRTDSSNTDERFLRNRVRRRLIPFLDRYFPHWREPVKTLGETQRMRAAFLTEEAEKRFPWEIRGEEFRLKAAQFFSPPQILRERALFAAIDALGTGIKNPRLKTLRTFAGGHSTAGDLGSCRLENNGGFVSVKNKVRVLHEAGFAVLIKKPGLYKLEAFTVGAFNTRPPGEETGFFAEYPVVLRAWGAGVLAEDRQGTAALLEQKGLFWKREGNRNNMSYFMIR
ncbi:MAG: tRNA lysidine(34) synthetase TilS [Spirochaetaceae bacterium]|nr:tRNA lysidine(34) synthetase TilS [Spirochaetaceae bacterium]